MFYYIHKNMIIVKHLNFNFVSKLVASKNEIFMSNICEKPVNQFLSLQACSQSHHTGEAKKILYILILMHIEKSKAFQFTVGQEYIKCNLGNFGRLVSVSKH